MQGISIVKRDSFPLSNTSVVLTGVCSLSTFFFLVSDKRRKRINREKIDLIRLRVKAHKATDRQVEGVVHCQAAETAK